VKSSPAALELAHHVPVGEVGLHGAFGEDELTGDLAVGLAFGDELSDLELARRKGLKTSPGGSATAAAGETLAEAAEFSHGFVAVARRRVFLELDPRAVEECTLSAASAADSAASAARRGSPASSVHAAAAAIDGLRSPATLRPSSATVRASARSPCGRSQACASA
jgi:hypothetical protein